MKPDTVLQLGDFEFSRYEVPEKIPFGGEQRLVMFKLVGGKRHIQAMGVDPAPIRWSGLFFGETARERARYVKGLMETGKAVELTWDAFRYRVVIREFVGDFERFYQIPYQICVEVVEDLTTVITHNSEPNVDDMINQDMTDVNGMGDLIGDGQLSTLLGTLNAAISTVSNFAKAAQSQINAVLKPLNAVQSRVKLLISSTNNTMVNVTTLGGILPNNPTSTNVSKFMAQVTAATRSPTLQQMDSVLGRMGKNLGTINSSSRSVTMAGGNLYRVAANEYGDAMGWTAIAKANGATDPVLTDINTIKVPPYNQDTGGVMNA